MEFVLLGGIAVHVGGGTLDLGPARQRCVLAALAVDAGHVVSVDRLTWRTWGDRSPLRARATLLNYLSRLRLLLADTGVAAVTRRAGGYSLDADRSSVDLLRFHDLRAQARAGDDRQAAALLRQALGLWRGEPLTGIDGEWADAERDRLRQHHLDAECELTDALLRLGHAEDQVAVLGARAAEWPLDERVAAQLMLALHRAGRTADALAHYRRLRDRLVDDLGTEPGTALRGLHRQILDADPALTTLPATIRGPVAEVPVPRQLPAPPRRFTGRSAELARLDEVLIAVPDEAARLSATGEGARDASTVVISAIGGAGGIGKTWLALQWAHRHAEEFPDGQLFVDLRGFSPDSTPMEPRAAVRGFIEAFGVAPDRVPVDLHAQVALFRSLVANKKVLVVLDNAADAAQVAHLIPGSPTCTVLVTSRTLLFGLVTGHGAHHLRLDVLDDVEARALLTARLGEARVGAEPQAVDELIRRCGGFPLALGIVAGRAHTAPDLPLSAVAAELRDSALLALDHADPAAGLSAILSWSCDALTAEQVTAFALLGTVPGPDFGLPTAAALLGVPTGRTRTVLRALEHASLLDRDARGRYRMHDLIRRYAADRAEDLPEADREAALRRVVDLHASTAYAADRALCFGSRALPAGMEEPAGEAHPLHDRAEALAWFEAEHATLAAAQRAAADRGWSAPVWQMAWSLITFHALRGLSQDRLGFWEVAFDAIHRCPDHHAQTLVRRFLGRACADVGRHGDALTHLHEALASSDDQVDQAHTHHALAQVWEARGDDRQALRHATEALHIYQAVDDPTQEAHALNAVGWYCTRLGDYETGRTRCEQALALHRAQGNGEGEAATLDSLALTEHRSGNHTRAADLYQQALDLHRDHADVFEEANARHGLARPLAALGRLDEARAAWHKALEMFTAQGREDDVEEVRRELAALGEAVE